MTEQTLFRSIVIRSYKLMFERPTLWFLGLLAAGIAGMGVIQLMYSLLKFFKETSNPTAQLSFAKLDTIYAWLMPPYQSWFLPIFALVLILMSIVIFLMTAIAFGALIRGTVDKQKQPLHTLWHSGTLHMWHMAALIVGRKIVVTLVSVGTVYLGVFISRTLGVWGNGINVGLWIVSVLLVAVVTFLSIYTATAMMIDSLHIKDALMKAVGVFRDHVLVSIEMALLLFGVEVIAMLIVASLFVLLAIPVTLLGIVTVFTKATVLFKIAIAAAFVIVFIIGLIVVGFITVFEVSAWASLYVRTREGVIKSRILHFFGVK